MSMVARFVGCLLALLAVCSNMYAADYLFKNGRTDYEIVLQNDASSSERTAANELQTYLEQISGASFSITSNPHDGLRHLYIGVAAPSAQKFYDSGDDGFTYTKEKGDIYIWGGKDRGTMYGVYAFLENELGVRWYTSDYTKIPQRTVCSFGKLNHSEEPSFGKRHVLYYDAEHSAVWCAHNRVNCNWSVRVNAYGGQTAIYGAHSLNSLVPYSLFKKHPEYFAQRQGKRIQNGQLCLTNPTVKSVVVDTLRTIMRSNKDYWAFDLSQADNSLFCECSKCQEIEDKYGAHSGLILWFVNQVADELYSEFPDKYLCTLAYRYTRKAPKGISPRRNVIVRLCDIECCFVHPLDVCEQNKLFMADLGEWHGITDNLCIWDYSTSFPHYLMPLPNFNVISDNLNIFQRYGCIGIMSEGTYNAVWGEFSEMKSWLLAKLMWDSHENVDQLAANFIRDYYGDAASAVLKYYNNLNALVKENTHLYISWRNTDECNADIFNDAFISRNITLLEKALFSVKNDSTKTRRLNRVLAQLYYLKSQRSKHESIIDGTVRKLKTIVLQDPTFLNERKQTIESYEKQIGGT